MDYILSVHELDSGQHLLDDERSLELRNSLLLIDEKVTKFTALAKFIDQEESLWILEVVINFGNVWVTVLPQSHHDSNLIVEHHVIFFGHVGFAQDFDSSVIFI